MLLANLTLYNISEDKIVPLFNQVPHHED